MTALLFATARNSILRKLVSGRTIFKKDGDEFVREMDAMGDQFVDPVKVKCRKKAYWARRKDFRFGLEAAENPSTIALFCHGSKNWIFGNGYNRRNIEHMAEHIADNASAEVFIILYACSCGKGKGDKYDIDNVPLKAGVAMMLADELAMRDVEFKIIAHTTRGHTTENPYVVFITKELNVIFKQTVVKRVTWWQGRKDKVGRKRWLKWYEMLKNRSDFRFKYPYMDKKQIEKILDGANV